MARTRTLLTVTLGLVVFLPSCGGGDDGARDVAADADGADGGDAIAEADGDAVEADAAGDAVGDVEEETPGDADDTVTDAGADDGADEEADAAGDVVGDVGDDVVEETIGDAGEEADGDDAAVDLPECGPGLAPCPTGTTCAPATGACPDRGVCIRTGTGTCGGFAGTPCPSDGTSCLYISSTDFGMCLFPDEVAAACSKAPSCFSCGP